MNYSDEEVREAFARLSELAGSGADPLSVRLQNLVREHESLVSGEDLFSSERELLAEAISLMLPLAFPATSATVDEILRHLSSVCGTQIEDVVVADGDRRVSVRAMLGPGSPEDRREIEQLLACLPESDELDHGDEQ